MVFRLALGSGGIEVQIDATEATYRLVDDGEPVELVHHGTAFTLRDRPVTFPIPESRAGTPPPQPEGRKPYRRSSPA
jgi:alpha,alpha-trehalose phosphorylase